MLTPREAKKLSRKDAVLESQRNSSRMCGETSEEGFYLWN